MRRVTPIFAPYLDTFRRHRSLLKFLASHATPTTRLGLEDPLPVTSDDLFDSLTVEEAAQKLHRSRRTVERLIAAGELDVIHIGSGRGRPVITRRAIEDYLNRHNQRRPR